MKLSQIKSNPDNPRIIKDIKFQKLVQSIKEFPKMMALRPMVIDAKGTVLGGNMRLKALKELNYTEIPEEWVKKAEDLSPEEIKRFIVVDNVGFGEHDWEALGNGWDLDELQEWGLDIPDFAYPKEAVEDDYQIPELSEIETNIILGDLFEIGNHRLLCGDSTKKEDIKNLMNGKKADMVFTDPPYGLGYEYNSYKDVKGKDYLKFCDLWFNNLLTISEFMVISTGWVYCEFWWGKKPKDIMYWLSRNKQTGGTVFHFRRIEPLFVWGKPKNKYNFDFFEEITDREDGLRDLHTCPKPVHLVASIIEGIKSKEIVCDIFMGSGTTMVAAHQLNRKCYGIEIDPKYCQVIVDRMLKLDPSLEVKKNGIVYENAVNQL